MKLLPAYSNPMSVSHGYAHYRESKFSDVIDEEFWIIITKSEFDKCHLSSELRDYANGNILANVNNFSLDIPTTSYSISNTQTNKA